MSALQATRETKSFKVVAVSSNCNSFGLRQHVLVAKDGEAYTGCITEQFAKKQGDVLEVPLNPKTFQLEFAPLGIELPNKLPRAPRGVVDQVWPSASALKTRRVSGEPL